MFDEDPQEDPLQEPPETGNLSLLDDLWAAQQANTSLKEGHPALSRFVGLWRMRATYDQYGFGPAMTAEGTAENRLALDGHYLTIRLSTSTPQGEYQGLWIYGYSPQLGKFHAALYDNIGVWPNQTEGRWDPSINAIVEEGQFVNAMYGTVHPVRARLVFLAPGHVVYTREVPDPATGEFVRDLEMDYRLIEPYTG